MESETRDDVTPIFEPYPYAPEERYCIEPFFTNLNRSVYAAMLISPELSGALLSRTSRAKGDLREVFLKEYLLPFLNPVRSERDTEALWREKVAYGAALKELIDFLHRHSLSDLFSNPRARMFYTTWLAQFGDDSIAQVAGMHLIFAGISQVAIKHIEDQRIGLAPIEKSTRYVDFSAQVRGSYLYYTDPELRRLGIEAEYRAATNILFETYGRLLPKVKAWLAARFPDEKSGVVEKKAFDLLRGLLPASTLSQVGFFGNGQAFEHLGNRSLRHGLNEVRWAGESAIAELERITPSFFRRLRDAEKAPVMRAYQEYLANKKKRPAPLLAEFFSEETTEVVSAPRVRLVEYDPEGEAKVITGILYASEGNHLSWGKVFYAARKMNQESRRRVLDAYLRGRTARWQRVGRAFENAYVRFDIVMNIGGWRDLQRHRMLTQDRQYFSCHHGFDVPDEIDAAGFGEEFREAIRPLETVFYKIEKENPELAQYAATLAHRMRFMQFENLRECFWEIELRTVPEGHPHYRAIEQKKVRLLQKAYPFLAERIMANMGSYDFARRGQEERIQAKIQKITDG